VEQGVNAIINTIAGEANRGTGRTVAESSRGGEQRIPLFAFGIIAAFIGFFTQLAVGISLGMRLTGAVKSVSRAARVLMPIPTLLLIFAWLMLTLEGPAGFTLEALLALAFLTGGTLALGVVAGAIGSIAQRTLAGANSWLISSSGSGRSYSSSSFSSSHSSSSFSSSSSSSSHSSSSSSSSFSGGGGSGGGGGASGSW
jgi:uncharacterized membrane protein YgcG